MIWFQHSTECTLVVYATLTLLVTSALKVSDERRFPWVVSTLSWADPIWRVMYSTACLCTTNKSDNHSSEQCAWLSKLLNINTSHLRSVWNCESILDLLSTANNYSSRHPTQAYCAFGLTSWPWLAVVCPGPPFSVDISSFSSLSPLLSPSSSATTRQWETMCLEKTVFVLVYVHYVK